MVKKVYLVKYESNFGKIFDMRILAKSPEEAIELVRRVYDVVISAEEVNKRCE